MNAKLIMDTELIKARSLLYRNIREFFDSKGYIEVETPILSPTLIPEPTIENFSTVFSSEFAFSREFYLVPSPEIFMKRLIANGSGSIYQISKCFRNAEQLGRLHNPEFTMLEYYTVGFDENDSIELTQQMFRQTAIPGCPSGLKDDFIVMSMAEALKRETGLELERIQNPATLRNAARRLGLVIDDDLKEPWADTFNRIFINFVEPSLNGPAPIVITDYPAQIECLAKGNGITKKRWELYFNGIEIANCYDEETDPVKVEEYFKREYASLAHSRASAGSVIPDIDNGYFRIFESFPECSGVAIGMDRLLMAECGKNSIEDLILFPFSDII